MRNNKFIFMKYIIANWKCNPVTIAESKKILNGYVKNIKKSKKTEVAICPPFCYLGLAKEILKSKISLGAQNCYWEASGAFTGEISAPQIADAGCKYVIIGHSERRRYFGETSESVNKKIKSALSFGLIPIVCVGDKERDENHEYFNFVKIQVEECLDGVKKDLIGKIIILSLRQ